MFIKNLLNDIFYIFGDWRIAIRLSKSIGIPDDWTGFKEIKGTSDFAFADPLLFEDERGTFLFVEAIQRKLNGKGCIGVFDLNGSKPVFKDIIHEDFHMSFPFVFRHSGETFMIPETNESGKIIVYKATSFPYQWEQYKTIDNIKCVDSVIYRSKYDNKLKLFTTKLCENESKYTTAIYNFNEDDFSVSLISEFTDNDMNMRNGGYVIEENRKLYRVAQNCKGKYGRNLIFNEILDDTNKYEEKVKKVVYPKDVDVKLLFKNKKEQLHTYSRSSNYECIDYTYTGWSLRHAIYWIKTFLKNHFGG